MRSQMVLLVALLSLAALFGGAMGASRPTGLASLVDSRERRRLVGQFRITPIDLLLNRTYPDTVCISRSAFDTHGQTVHPVFFLRGTGKRGDRIRANVPYRAILPRETEGLVVAGLGISAHRDAMPVLRMKADMRNLGYAAGLAASLSAKSGVPLGKLDVKALQRKLIEIGNLPEAVLDAKDNLPLPDEAFAAAAKRLADGYGGLAEILSDPSRAMPHLKRETSFEALQVRALLGDADAAPALIKRLDGAAWDEGWNFKGMSQYDRSVSEMDALVIALGLTRSEKALPVLDALARQLTGESEYSHFRAIARALEEIGDRRRRHPRFASGPARCRRACPAVRRPPADPGIFRQCDERGALGRAEGTVCGGRAVPAR